MFHQRPCHLIQFPDTVGIIQLLTLLHQIQPLHEKRFMFFDGGISHHLEVIVFFLQPIDQRSMLSADLYEFCRTNAR